MTNIDVSLEELLESGAHFGHMTRRWNPKMSDYLYGEKEGIHIFDLVKTKQALLSALNHIKDAVSEGKVVLVVGTKKQIKDKIKQICEETATPYVNSRWLGGTLTNFEQVKKSIRYLKSLQEGLESGEYKNRTKKERLEIEKTIAKMLAKFGGILNLEKHPDLMVVIDINKEKGAVIEGNRLGIPVVGIVDSNSDPDLVNYPIPMNDDAKAALELVVDLIGQAIKAGKTTTKTVKKTKKAKK